MEIFKKNTSAYTTGTDEALYDLSILVEMDDDEYLLEMLSILLTDVPKDLKEMKKAVQAGKPAMVCQAAHKLKGSAGIIQATKLTELLVDIEAIGKDGVINKDLACLVDNAANEYSSIEKKLKIYVQELNK
ncbi:MAG: HPt (Histidine-containing phosphotransfer) protein [Ferruginibacter sp.]|nr:HPt (Histidine-containing phosphotransfer) protein [Ferruginibacter sp.]